MKKYMPILIGLILIFSMTFTNPTKAEFLEFMEDSFKKDYLNSNSNTNSAVLDGILSNLGGKIVHMHLKEQL